MREGVDKKDIAVTGNSVIDALKFVSKQAEPKETKDILEKDSTPHESNDKEKPDNEKEKPDHDSDKPGGTDRD